MECVHTFGLETVKWRPFGGQMEEAGAPLVGDHSMSEEIFDSECLS